ncbi:ABC-three component system protein [Thalassotalea profundi]|uniref:ABC-three component systems C-terminal domain-containing protein n=1 Tax=Thalassotalea profundi TaxID=2036687 RepID=A0ABQ3IH26_9GAMM|nr:ABC-three component system protein [Thalassotalea profundi]GHE80148.1 hypothetical protein GCM10011501_04970 [Thalassotalea profundi]
MSKSRDYTDKTIKRLFGLARNKCSFPGCEKEMSDETSALHSNICHIEAAEEGGQRWNSNMTDKQRADYNNLILLCPPHHGVTNDESIYTVDVLQKMKKDHQLEMAKRIDIEKSFSKRPSLITEVINKISTVDIDELESLPVKNSFSIENKISYNNVVLNKPLLRSYGVYQGKINALYSELERAGSPKKQAVLKIIHHFYLQSQGEYLNGDNTLTNIRKNADKLIDAVCQKLHEAIDDSANNDLSITFEELEFGISIIVVDGFMRCKILEEPANDS